MAKTITPEMFAATVQGILAEYEGDLQKNMAEATRKVSKAGAKAVNSAARSKIGGTGKYASGWTARVEVKRLYTEGVIYNGKLPGLAHLLEHGHAKRSGGRTRVFEHILPVEKEVIEEFENEVKNGL